MRLSPRNTEEPDVNLTPMIDVVFLLLLFFMVSTSFIRESSLKVDLPEATGQALVEQDKAIDIVINADGQFVVDTITLDKPSNEQLAKVLKKAVGDNTDPHIIISADANAEYQNIVTAMDTAQQLGYTRLTLATRQTTSKEP
ncbi:MAG: biopolymer transporter ExbD [Gammaproteobacteria bacterium]|nr:MAG: biopolymer transporter ExbD [Gammaproteobacteria bacterium]